MHIYDDKWLSFLSHLYNKQSRNTMDETSRNKSQLLLESGVICQRAYQCDCECVCQSIRTAGELAGDT